MEEQRAAVVEVNAGPGLQMHLQPSTGKPRPVGEAIVATLFPPGESGRIPLVCVAGDESSELAQWVAHLLAADHQSVGLSLPEGIWIAGRRIDTAGLSRGAAMRNVLINPGVEAAVLEMSHEMVREEGLCVDDCDVAILLKHDAASTNGSAAAADPLDESMLTERLLVGAVRRSGAAILPAAEATDELLKHCQGSIVLYGVDGTADGLAQHRALGGRAVYVDNKRIVASEGHRQKTILSLGRLAAQTQGRPAYDLTKMLAAVAAAWVLGVEPEQIADQLVALLTSNRPATSVTIVTKSDAHGAKQYSQAAQ
jgi:cyanophycin synthetase